MARQISITPDEFPRAELLFREAVKEHLEKQDIFYNLEEMGKDVLASIMGRIEKAQPRDEKISESKLERLARCDKDWTDYKEGLYQARLDAGRAKARYVQADRYWQTLQSALAYKRDEMAYLRGGA